MTTCTYQDCGRPTGRVLAKYCDAHRWRMRLKRPTWPLTPEREAYLRAHYNPTVRNISTTIAQALGVPKWRVTKWAGELGLATPERREPFWTPEQDAFLETHMGSRTVVWMARKLGRTCTAVSVRMKRLELYRRDNYEWMSATQTALGFGVDPTTVVRWIKQGKLHAKTFGKDHADRHHAWQIWPSDLIAFVEAHPGAFLLSKVDQVWFLDLVLRTPRRTRTKVA